MIKNCLLKRINVINLLLGLFFLFSAVGNVYASTVRINKPKIRLQISSGGSQSDSITVANPSEETIKVKAYLEDWVYAPTQDGIKNFALPGTTPLSCAKWISFSPAEFNIPAYGSQDVFYSIKVPQGVQGGYYAVLFFETVVGTTQNEEGVDILIKGRIGSLFYIEVGSINKKVTLTELSIKKKTRGFNVEAVLKNVGNVDILTKGTFNIIDKQGIVFARGKFNDVYAFPGEQANISSGWSDIIPQGSYDLIITLDLGDMPLIKEAQIDIGPSGEVVHVGLKE